MNEDQLLERITSNPQVLAGKPVIKGTRLSVDYILNLLAHGTTAEDIVDEYAGLSQEDVRACLLFPQAKDTLRNQTALTPGPSPPSGRGELC